MERRYRFIGLWDKQLFTVGIKIMIICFLEQNDPIPCKLLATCLSSACHNLMVMVVFHNYLDISRYFTIMLTSAVKVYIVIQQV